eukprot:31048-Pelagococcus_subviridis.AAC.1
MVRSGIALLSNGRKPGSPRFEAANRSPRRGSACRNACTGRRRRRFFVTISLRTCGKRRRQQLARERRRSSSLLRA